MSLPVTDPAAPRRSPVPPILPPDDPRPGGDLPDEMPAVPEEDEVPVPGPNGPRTPYPVDDPGIRDPVGPGSEPDYLPGQPTDPGTRF